MFFPNKLILYLCLINIFGYFELNADQQPQPKIKETDYPSNRKDVLNYLKALEKLAKFAYLHKNKLADYNFYFGLLLSNVNLRNIINDQILMKKLDRPFVRVIYDVRPIMKKFSDLIINFKENNYFHPENAYNNILNDTDFLSWKILSNESEWARPLKRFNFDLLKVDYMAKDSTEDKDYVYDVDLDAFVTSVRNVYLSIPDPDLADECQLTITSENKINITNHVDRPCVTAKDCVDMLQNGDNFGYALTHRFLYILLAQISRGCYVITPERDQEWRNDLCAMMYEEAKFILRNKLPLEDLFLEHVTLCTLDGHAQFLTHAWMSKILSHQTVHGCFKEEIVQNSESPAMVFMDNEATIKANCDLHITGLAATALAAAIRFVLERNATLVSSQ